MWKTARFIRSRPRLSLCRECGSQTIDCLTEEAILAKSENKNAVKLRRRILQTLCKTCFHLQ